MRHFICVCYTLLLLSEVSFATTSDLKKGCDIPGENYTHKKLTNEVECKASCDEDKKCQAFTFISGWNRCNLKTSFKKSFNIEMIAGYVDGRETKTPTLSQYFFSSDSTGKDMKSITTLKDHKQCGQACLTEERCLSFVYIKGYSMCWLKKTKGRIIDKVFYCGHKPKA